MKDVLNGHLDRIDHAVSNSEEYSKIPPLDIIVLTDGVPSVLFSLTAIMILFILSL